MNLKIKKVDAIIIVVLISIAGIVFYKVGYIPNPLEKVTPNIEFIQDDENNTLTVISVSTVVKWDDINITGECDTSSLDEEVVPGDIIKNCRGTITIKYLPKKETVDSFKFKEENPVPTSVVLPAEHTISSEDEGPHYTKLLSTVSREWWTYTVIFNKNSELAGWTATISFNHMARNDLSWDKPDVLIVVLHSPDGKEYGNIIEKERGLGILKEPTLIATSSDKSFKVTYEDSYIQGHAPDWHVHVEGEDIDPEHKLIIDLQFFAPSDGIWIHSNGIIDKSDGRIASYIFIGCEVTGSVEIDGIKHDVKGTGHHQHTWVSGLLTKLIIRGWDWCYMTLDNGWNIYYSNYYLLPQLKATKTSNINPLATLIITTDQGKTITKLNDVNIEILKSDKLFMLLNVPVETKITAKPSLYEILLSKYKINLDLTIKSDNTYEHEWKRFSYVGMKIGQSTISGKITWSDDETHTVNLNGIGTIWNMRH